MNRLIRDIAGGVLVTALFIIITITLIKSSDPDKFLSLYIGLELIAFLFFSIYGAAAIAAVATFVALAALLIATAWFSLAAIVTYWSVILILNSYLEDVTKKYGRFQLELENREKEIAELSGRCEKNTSLIPIFKSRLKRYMFLSDFSLKLSTSFNSDTLYSFIIEYVRKFYPDKEISIINDPEDQFDRWVIEKNKPLLVENTGKDYRFKKDPDNMFSLIACPLCQEQQFAGAVRVESYDDSFTAADLRLLSVASTLSSIALSKAGLFLRTQELAITDSLTGLYTHKYFKERLEEEVKRAARYNEEFVVFMMDIDKFKKVNDIYGHQAGDSVLKVVAETIRKIVRETDIAGRYGGEEISVLMHNTKPASAKKIAERIRKSIESHVFNNEGAEFSVTMTIGASLFPGCPTSEELLRRADEALYSGKNSGRNKVVFYEAAR